MSTPRGFGMILFSGNSKLVTQSLLYIPVYKYIFYITTTDMKDFATFPGRNIISGKININYTQ
jgi:hypothetical protein